LIQKITEAYKSKANWVNILFDYHNKTAQLSQTHKILEKCHI